MEPWTCEGLHRICCIPCGHVYGRSCLEKWLHENAKCPQCKLQFEDKLIINLYTPANFGDGCGTIQVMFLSLSSVPNNFVAHVQTNFLVIK
uniref:RING-type domain-containing protein n=1 Tax=Triticum urartu TaxID=4572 RepID=A0A8R7QZU7_TRIUA